jgi:ribonucleoside-diphosphate reductase alpha chain
VKITIEVVSKIHDSIETSLLDSFTAEICHAKIIEHPHFGVLASRLLISDHHKQCKILTDLKFSNLCKTLNENLDQLGKPSPLISEELHNISQEHADLIDSMIVHDRDFLLDYFGFKTLYKSYLMKSNGKVVETPQHMFMRVALGMHGNIKTKDKDSLIMNQYKVNFDLVKETYDLLSQKYFTHATPTLYNAGTNRPQLSSCFLYKIDDSLDSIYKVLSDTAHISKWSGGVGISITSVRGNKSYIRGTGGNSDGIVPMLKVYNDTARYVNQGGGKRLGSFAMYIEPWHCDIVEFLKCKLPHGDENTKSRDLFYALWVPDLFMERVKKDQNWSLMCPSECPGLENVYGNDFKKLYEKYESEGKVTGTVKAADLFKQIISSQIETGTPYFLYKDHSNHKSNHKNIGTIKNSNLCAEIMEYSDTSKYACCVLASIVLSTYVDATDPKKPKFDYEKLYSVTRVVTRNLNKVIDINYYPVPETRASNMSERPIGIGIQGLADVFFKMHYAYDSRDAIKLDKEIMETIYFAALSESVELAKIYGSYESYKGSPISEGQFQFDLWNKYSGTKIEHSGRWNWEELRKNIQTYGLRNSLVTALMPTASTSQIMGSMSESFEPITSNAYTRRTLAGEFIILNKYLIDDLIKLGLWSEKMSSQLMESRGSIQNIPDIPTDIKNIYKTVWEIKQKVLIDHSIARAIYVDQSQSLNLYFEDANYDVISKAHFYGWTHGLKTGSYYIRSQPAIRSAAFTNVDSSMNTETETVGTEEQQTNFFENKKSTKTRSRNVKNTKESKGSKIVKTKKDKDPEPAAVVEPEQKEKDKDCEMCGS